MGRRNDMLDHHAAAGRRAALAAHGFATGLGEVLAVFAAFLFAGGIGGGIGAGTGPVVGAAVFAAIMAVAVLAIHRCAGRARREARAEVLGPGA